jgi:hypothetical protein
MKYITKEAAGKLIKAYEHSAETGEGGKEVLAKFFTPWAGATWYITEGMPLTENGDAISLDNGYREFAAEHADKYDWHLFGFCDLGDPVNAELGYVLLSDLKGLNGPFGLKVERDLYYEGTLDEVLEKYGRAA